MTKRDITAETGAEPERDVKRTPAVRGKDGRFVAGAPSPNPGGRPKSDGELVELARAATPETFAFVLATMRNPKASRRDRIRCAEIVLERAHGKPAQAISVGGPDGKPLQPPYFAISFADDGPGGFPTDPNEAARAYAAFVAGKPYVPQAPRAALPARLPAPTSDDDVEVSPPAGPGERVAAAPTPKVPAPTPAPSPALPRQEQPRAESAGGWGAFSIAVGLGPLGVVERQEPLEGIVETRSEREARQRRETEEANNAQAALQRRAGLIRDWRVACEDARLNGEPPPPRPAELDDAVAEMVAFGQAVAEGRGL